MAKALLIVESPTKMKTISKFLGKDFVIRATNGHIKDLPKSKFGVDIESGFAPQFEVLKGKSKAVDEIRKSSANIKKIYIGSDPDREGEAIAFHVAEELGQKKEIYRVLFHEITKNGVLEALQSPTTLNVAKYDAQKARRILDRIVGYKISPLLWEKVKYGLSAGRVQSVALRLVCDRENEIDRFIREEYWVIEIELRLPSGETFMATLDKIGDTKARVGSQGEAGRIKEDIEDKAFRITNVEIKEKNINPQPAFITSRLQQEASRKLKFSPKRTMVLAQQLYEGIDMGEEGPTGLITYMRTDSVRVSTEATAAAREYIENNFGSEYLPKTPTIYKNKKNAQDAHEAIRPTYVHLTPDSIRKYLDKDLFMLYDLIWKRFIASQMMKERLETKTVEISADRYVFTASGSTILFDGFTKIYEEQSDEESQTVRLPDINKNENATLLDTILNQKFTSPPPRYSEATLIKTLEMKGIGRPSTYATIVSTIQDRSYAKRDAGRLMPTPLGRTVNKLLVEFFPMIVNIDFTVKMEERLDQIEDGKKNWVKSLKQFNDAFEDELSHAKVRMKDLKKEERETDILCDKCGKNMLLRWGKNGEYIVCSGKPACKNKKNVRSLEDGSVEIIKDEIRGLCPKCGGSLIEKSGRFGRFLACSNYPECKHTESYSLGFLCPAENCSGKLVERVSKKKKRFISCSRYPDCTFATNLQPTEGTCPACNAPTLFTFRKKQVCQRKECGWKSQ